VCYESVTIAVWKERVVPSGREKMKYMVTNRKEKVSTFRLGFGVSDGVIINTQYDICHHRPDDQIVLFG